MVTLRRGQDSKFHPLIDSGLVGSGRGTTRAEDAQGTPTQNNISLSILVYEDKQHTTVLKLLRFVHSIPGRAWQVRQDNGCMVVTLSHSLSLALSLSLSLAHILPLTLTLSLSRTHTPSHCHCHSHSHSRCMMVMVSREFDPRPMSIECGTCKTVTAKLWPWLSGERTFNV